jgi:ABC-type antimicrobial peptide transport system permease subunit
MALGAIAAHKLRSTLTLLGVLVGVFSIIVVMTAMRVMQSNIETQLSSLGNQTFMIRKWPGTYWGVSGDLENIGGGKISRRARSTGWRIGRRYR